VFSFLGSSSYDLLSIRSVFVFLLLSVFTLEQLSPPPPPPSLSLLLFPTQCGLNIAGRKLDLGIYY
jgi:hypothetical protein